MVSLGVFAEIISDRDEKWKRNSLRGTPAQGVVFRALAVSPDAQLIFSKARASVKRKLPGRGLTRPRPGAGGLPNPVLRQVYFAPGCSAPMRLRNGSMERGRPRNFSMETLMSRESPTA